MSKYKNAYHIFFLNITGCSKDYVIERISKIIVPCKKQDEIAHWRAISSLLPGWQGKYWWNPSLEFGEAPGDEDISCVEELQQSFLSEHWKINKNNNDN